MKTSITGLALAVSLGWLSTAASAQQLYIYPNEARVPSSNRPIKASATPGRSRRPGSIRPIRRRLQQGPGRSIAVPACSGGLDGVLRSAPWVARSVAMPAKAPRSAPRRAVCSAA